MDTCNNYDQQFCEWFTCENNLNKLAHDLKYLKTDMEFIITNKTSYMTDKAFLSWLEKVVKQTNFADVHSYSGLLTIRGVEYSNAALYSSSRMALELFNQRTVIESMLYECFPNDDCLKKSIKKRWYKVYLEKILPFTLKNGDTNTTTNSHMDVFIELFEDKDKTKLAAVLAIECKMKEIYAPEENVFEKSYGTILRTLFPEKAIVPKDDKHQLMMNGDVKSRFYYKQQVCHLLGLYSNYFSFKDINGIIDSSKSSNVKVGYANFVFDPQEFDFGDEINNAYKKYVQEASENDGDGNNSIMSQVIEAFNNIGLNGVTYCGVFSQDSTDSKNVKVKRAVSI